METKLDLVLKDFAEKERKPWNFRNDTIFAASMGGAAGGATLGAALTGKSIGRAMTRAKDSDLSPAAIALAISVPFTAAAGLRAALAAKDLNKAQRLLNTVGGVDNLSDEEVNRLFYNINKGTISIPKQFERYLPQEENDKFNAQIGEIETKYPLDKSMKKTPEYKQNKALREEALKDIRTQQARALLKYAKLSNTTKKSV